MKTAVITISVGDRFQRIASLTHPTLKAYADRIGADFLVIDKPKISKTTPHFEKFQFYHLLNEYERILYLDTDLVIRPDCPNLFELVPYSKLGAFNEGAFTDRTEAMRLIAQQYQTSIKEWKRQYYNTGVMVLSRAHKFLFKPPVEEICNFYEQSYLNLQIINAKTPIQDLTYKFNRMSIMDPITGEHRLASHIIHYAGCPGGDDFLLDLIGKDLKKWEVDAPEYKYPKNIRYRIHGGIGDAICAEPVARHLNETIYPNDNIIVETWFPGLFKHLKCNVIGISDFKPEFDTPYHKIDSMVNEEHVAWQIMSPNLMNTTDFISLVSLRKILPDDVRQIRLAVTSEDIAEVIDVTKAQNLSELILVHPGKGWNSKTFPKKYWQDILDGLVKAGKKVAVIGKSISNEQGTVEIDPPESVLDLRDLLSLSGLIALISQARVLISNDSAPIHIGSAFDNYIILIPTCKHPDWVLNHRKGNRYHKAAALYKKLMSDEYKSDPMNLDGETVDKVPGDYMEYLPDPEVVVNKALEFSR